MCSFDNIYVKMGVCVCVFVFTQIYESNILYLYSNSLQEIPWKGLDLRGEWLTYKQFKFCLGSAIPKRKSLPYIQVNFYVEFYFNIDSHKFNWAK